MTSSTNPSVRAGGPQGAIPDGSVFYRVINESGTFVDPCGPGDIGNPGV